jgi:hypothetical protein
MEPDDIDLAYVEFWRRPLSERAAAFATLRARPGLSLDMTRKPAEWTPAGPR